MANFSGVYENHHECHSEQLIIWLKQKIAYIICVRIQHTENIVVIRHIALGDP